jgi:Tol biopolymer transport system component
MRARMSLLVAAIALSLWSTAGLGVAGPALRDRRIAFGFTEEDKHGVFVVRADGSGMHRVSHGVSYDFPREGYAPAWSNTRPWSQLRPWIAFSGTKNQVSGIFRVRPDGSNQQRLTRAPCYADFSPSWAPGGNRMVYRHDTCETARLFVMDVGGGNREKITRVPSFGPVWSPSSEVSDDHIAFTTLDRSQGHFRYQVAVVRPDGNGFMRVTTSPEGDTEGNRDPSFSPLGLNVVYTAGVGISGDSDREVCRVGVDGTHQRCLTDRGENFDAEWRPVGGRIAFVSIRKGDSEIFTMNRDGSRKKALTSNHANELNPTWSPDGRFIAFLSSRDGNFDLYVMRKDGSHVHRVTNARGMEKQIEWEP